jgi:hypothetical protein
MPCINRTLFTLLATIAFWTFSQTKVQEFTFTHRKFLASKSAYVTKFIFGAGKHK